MSPSPSPLQVHLLALPETTPAVFYGLFEVFSAVGDGWTALTGESGTVPPPQVRMVSRAGGMLTSPAGIPLGPLSPLAGTPRADIAVATDLDLGGADFDPRGRWPEEAHWLAEQHRLGATVCSVCTGSVLLAEAGLLAGLDATTHWGAADIFARHYPEVRLRADRILCPAGAEHRIVTSGGSATWADLALYLIGRFCGAAEAVRIAKLFVIGDHSDGQLPFAARLPARHHEDAVVEQCQAWIAEHYDEPNPVATLVRRSKLPERTFKRRFKAATGYSPVEYVQILRVEEAKQLLESTTAPVDAIAQQVGYTDPTFFRRLFKRRTGVTPARYRQRFQRVASN